MRDVFMFLAQHWVLTGVALIVLFAMIANLLTGAVLISERQVGIVGDRKVRIVPDVAVSGASANTGLVDGLLGVMLRNQNGSSTTQKN